MIQWLVEQTLLQACYNLAWGPEGRKYPKESDLALVVCMQDNHVRFNPFPFNA